jgi:hypothetical protein
MATFAILAFDVTSSANADTSIGYTADGTYNGTRTVTGTFHVDATTDVVTAVALNASASG